LDESDEPDLIARVLAGERDAFHVLLQRHNAPVFATLRATLAQREDAREVLQETWLRAYRNLSRLRDRARFRAWLLAIAFNLARARQRRARERTLEEEEAHALLAEPLVESGLEREDELAQLRLRMRELPARQREVLDLRVNHELSHAEIARLLAITEEASRASYYQAIRHLEKALRPAGGGART